jgi:hypothetical protein
MLMVGALGSPAAPTRGPTIDDFYVDGGRSWISASTSQEAHRRCFLELMVDVPGSPALASPRGLTIEVS